MSVPAPSPQAYAFPLRALRRWRAEHLRLTPEVDGGWRALFRLEGSTCGNIPFRLHYRVLLAPAAEGFRLRELSCEPAPHDAGHLEQCAAKAGLERLLATLRAETPLLGCPLDEVLAWQPATAPDGCLCAAPARVHKWRAVLQTIHFALHDSSR